MPYENFYPVRIEWENFPQVTTPLDEINLNKMDYALYKIAEMLGDWYNSKANTVDLNTQTERIDTLEITKANQSDLLQDIKSVEYNSTTGVWKFTHQNGTVNTFDQNIEKIPVSFSMSPQGVITMRTADGTEYTADIASLIKTYTFNDSSVIDFTTTTDSSGNKKITATIKSGSITENMLQPNFLADCRTAKNEAQTAAINANNKATQSANSATLSQSYAKGGTNTRAGEDTDNAEYYKEQAKEYAEQAEAIVGIGIATTSKAGIVKPDGQTVFVDSTGKITAGISESDWSTIQNILV